MNICHFDISTLERLQEGENHKQTIIFRQLFRACLHGGGGPQLVGEETR